MEHRKQVVDNKNPDSLNESYNIETCSCFGDVQNESYLYNVDNARRERVSADQKFIKSDKVHIGLGKEGSRLDE